MKTMLAMSGPPRRSSRAEMKRCGVRVASMRADTMPATAKSSCDCAHASPPENEIRQRALRRIANRPEQLRNRLPHVGDDGVNGDDAEQRDEAQRVDRCVSCAGTRHVRHLLWPVVVTECGNSLRRPEKMSASLEARQDNTAASEAEPRRGFVAV